MAPLPAFIASEGRMKSRQAQYEPPNGPQGVTHWTPGEQQNVSG